ncbi:MAG: YggU family protein [Chloroflexi bacterium RBG_16_57_8]|nr:MAG: YggU family protein [Chloroflexi bacterium RBG_16_57_8]
MYAIMVSKERARIRVHVHPNASRNQIVGFRDDVLHVKIAAPPVEGKANQELVGFLSGLLGVGKSSVTIERGAIGRRKTVAVSGLERGYVIRLLAQ